MGNICSNKNNWEDNTHNHVGIKPIIIETETWKRDSHGLFDYETNDVIRKTLKIAGTAQIFREVDDLQFLDYSYRKIFKKTRQFLDDSREIDLLSNTEREDMEDISNMPKEMVKMTSRNTINKLDSFDAQKDPIVHILYKEGHYWIYNKAFYNKDDDFISNPEKLIWYTVRDYRNSASSLGYKLKTGDILKFGRARLRVTEISIGDGASNLDTRIKGGEVNEEIALPDGFLPGEADMSETMACRICFSAAESDNQLISPCKCSGSLKFIHYKWLKNWLESKRTIKSTETTISYHWKSLEWELCKTIYPELVKTQYSLVSYHKPNTDYMILESISSSPAKSVYVVDLDTRNDIFKIGRGHDSDIRVSDISVSRCHALIAKTENNELVIKDNNSKFGTLVCLQHPLLLSEFDSIHLQAGRTLLEIQMKEKKDWTLKSWLWVRQDNTGEEAIRTENYLGKFGYTDSFLPDEFKLFWHKNKNRANSMQLRKTYSSPGFEGTSLIKKQLGTEADLIKEEA